VVCSDNALPQAVTFGLGNWRGMLLSVRERAVPVFRLITNVTLGKRPYKLEEP